MSEIKLYNGDCLEVMEDLIKKGIKVDAIITDPPYGTTACKWDSVIPFDKMWLLVKQLRKNDNTPIILFGREPYTSKLVCSNIKEYRHKWIWNKKQSGSFANAKYMPLQIEEDIICFSKEKIIYYPIMRIGKYRNKGGYNYTNEIQDGLKRIEPYYNNVYYPTNILEFTKERGLHPTQKPVELLEYLIKTYTNEGETVLDFTMGSGTTGVACKLLNRNFIGIELDEKYFKIAEERIKNTNKKGLF